MINLKIAFRSILYRFRQYIALFTICALSVAFSLSVMYLSRGMLKALSDKARIYYGGDLVFMRFPKNDYGQNIDNYSIQIKKLEKFFPTDAIISERFDFDAKNAASLYCEGNESRLNIIKGISYQKESSLINRLTFVSRLDNISNLENWCFISTSVANRLCVECGGNFILYLKTYEGYINTIEMNVAGIFEDSSVFGMYTMYMDFNLLKKICQMPENWANRICINFPGRRTVSETEINNWNEALKTEFNMFKVCSDKQEFYDGVPYEQDTCALIPLKANLNNTSILEKALNIIITLVIVILGLITIIGISSTFKVIVSKRIAEIGIYKSIGMKTFDLLFSLVCETLLVLILGCICGILLSVVICEIVRIYDFTCISNLNIFLTGGHILGIFNLKMTLIIIMAIIFSTLVAVTFSIKKYVTILPVKALFTNK